MADAKEARGAQRGPEARGTDNGSSKKLVLIVVAIAIAMMLAMGGAIFYLWMQLSQTKNPDTKEPAPAPIVVQPGKPGPMVALDEMVINIGGAASGHYAKVRIALEFYDEANRGAFYGMTEEELKKIPEPDPKKVYPNLYKTRDVILDVIARSQPADFDNVSAMKKKMVDEVNRVVGKPAVKDVHFLERAVQ